MGIALRKYFKSLADYKELRLLGRGACGEVFLCEEKSTGAHVAVKKINDIADEKDQRHFIREIIVPLKLDLPGIVKLVGFRFPEPDVPALIITELMPNGALDTILKSKHEGRPTPNFGPTEQSKAVFGIAATMAEVHKHNAIHRDLKPGNVFLDPNWEVRIADFGLARVVTAGVKMTMAIGSPMFMAPELFDDDDNYSFPVDVYAYGIILYQLFSNQQILEGSERAPRSPQQLMTAVARGQRYKRPNHVPNAFWNLITKCWAHAPADRPRFEDIANEMLASDDYTFPGTDLGKYHEYRERMKPRAEEEITETSKGSLARSGELRMSSLASGNRLFADEMRKSMRMSMNLGRVGEESDADQALRRYDFTRSSLKKA
jgi:serine/threonine protein kinase